MDHLDGVLGCDCVKRRHEGGRNCGFLAICAQGVLKLRLQHVDSPVVEIHGAMGLGALNCDLGLAFILLSDFGELGQTKIGYGPS